MSISHPFIHPFISSWSTFSIIVGLFSSVSASGNRSMNMFFPSVVGTDVQEGLHQEMPSGREEKAR